VIDLAYRLFLRPLLFRLEAERAHHVTINGLRLATALGWDRLLAPSETGLALAQPVRAMGLSFPNRVGLAAGLDKAGLVVDGLGAMGFGHVEVGTITPRPQPGNPQPRLFRLPEHEAIINRMGFNNPGLEQALANIAPRRWPGIVGFNIGKNFDTPNERATEDYLAGLRGAYAQADYIAVNISSPNTKGLRDLQGEEVLRGLIRALKEEQCRLSDVHARYTPIAIKIAPDLELEHVQRLAGLFLAEGIDGVIATNTTLSRAAVAGHPRAAEAGGLSGRPVGAASTAIIATLRAEMGVALPIIGVGGIFSAADARAKLEAGATLVQLYTGFIYRGPALVHEILRDLA
jgi:dihydroorotate dehydrogenase